MMRASRLAVTSGVIGLSVVAALAHQAAKAPATLDAATRTAVIDGAIEQMRRAYIFADVAEKMATDLRARAARGDEAGDERDRAEQQRE